MLVLTAADPVARPLVEAIRGGDVGRLRGLLDQRPELATARLRGDDGAERTPLHIVTDWPGYFPNGPAVAALLLERGADPNATLEGGSVAETPLHWTASSDDVEVAEVLIDGGAEVEAPGGSIGTPLGNAVGYACWRVARLLVARGARVDALWHAAGLGLSARVRALLPAASPAEVSQAFYHACAGGHRRTAELVLSAGADLNFVPEYAGSTPPEAASGHGTGREALLRWLREQGARPAAG